MSTSRLLGAMFAYIFEPLLPTLNYRKCNHGLNTHILFRTYGKILTSLFTALSVLFYGGTASAYFVQLDAQALSQQDANVVSYFNYQENNITSDAFDSGLVTGSNPLFGYAQNSVSVDLAAGTLRLYAMSSSNQVAGGSATLYDILTFSLPAGMTSTMVTAYLTIDGSVSGSLNAGTLPQDLYFQCISAAPTCSSGDGHDTVSLHDFSSPTTLAVPVLISDGATLQIQASISGSTGSGINPGDVAVIDLSNTGRLSLNLESGVTFTSESGVFLTAIPVPAAFWLFSSGLLGLIGIARRKKAA